MDPPKINFCLAQTRAPVLFFDINRYNRQIFRHSGASLTVRALFNLNHSNHILVILMRDV